MNSKGEHSDDYRSLLLLDEISRNEELTQRDLSRKLGVALGLINSYIKNLASKGLITVRAIPKKRYRYYLTPRGLAEKTRLTYQHLQNFTNLYRVARRDFEALFKGLERTKTTRIVFCGVDEVTEIAYLSLAGTEIELAGIIDGDVHGKKKFFGRSVMGFEGLRGLDFDLVVITSFNSSPELMRRLKEAGVPEKRICDISSEGWMKRMGS